MAIEHSHCYHWSDGKEHCCMCDPSEYKYELVSIKELLSEYD